MCFKYEDKMTADDLFPISMENIEVVEEAMTFRFKEIFTLSFWNDGISIWKDILFN